MSRYANKFKDGPNDKPRESRRIKNNSTEWWGNGLRGATPGSAAAKKLGTKSGSAAKKQTGS